jgi:hypothetical protein
MYGLNIKPTMANINLPILAIWFKIYIVQYWQNFNVGNIGKKPTLAYVVKQWPICPLHPILVLNRTTVLNNLTPFCPEDAFIIYTPAERSRSESPYLLKPAKASNRHLSLLFFRCVEAWNALPGILKSSPSLPAFKRGLKQVDLSKFRKGSAI